MSVLRVAKIRARNALVPCAPFLSEHPSPHKWRLRPAS
jgi:hypothetical protein